MNVIQPVIDQGEVVIDQGKVRLDLDGCFVMQTCERKVTRVVIKVGQVVMRFYVARVAFQRLGKILERTDRLTAVSSMIPRLQ